MEIFERIFYILYRETGSSFIVVVVASNFLWISESGRILYLAFLK